LTLQIRLDLPPQTTSPENNSDISYQKTSQACEHFNPLKSSLRSHSQLVSDSVGIMSSCSLLAFLRRQPHFIASLLPLLLGISNS